MKKILIPNVTGPTNAGDQAMFQALLRLINSSQTSRDIYVHTKNSELYEKSYPYKVFPSLYQYIAMDTRNPFISVYRFIEMLILLFMVKIGDKKNGLLQRTLSHYKNADLILFAGGGYIRSRTGIKQSVNLFFQLLPFTVGKFCVGAKIIAPISFGPFAYQWQAKIAAWTLNGCDVVSARESRSYETMKSLGVKNLVLSTDLALLTKKTKRFTKNYASTRPLIGFTIRNWLNEGNEQNNLEKACTLALTKFVEKFGAEIQPIIQVESKDFPYEDDARSVARVCALLNKAKIAYRRPIRIQSVDHAMEAYGRLDLLLGMRMHSNIFAAIQGIPFVAVSYEYKTEGISEQIRMKKYCVSCKKANVDNLFNLLESAYKNKIRLKNQLIQSIAEIQHKETNKWNRILNTV